MSGDVNTVRTGKIGILAITPRGLANVLMTVQCLNGDGLTWGHIDD